MMVMMVMVETVVLTAPTGVRRLVFYKAALWQWLAVWDDWQPRGPRFVPMDWWSLVAHPTSVDQALTRGQDWKQPKTLTATVPQ